jgi:hypothetical protein
MVPAAIPDLDDIDAIKRRLLDLAPKQVIDLAQLEDRLDACLNDLSWESHVDTEQSDSQGAEPGPANGLSLADVIETMDKDPVTATLFPLYLRRCCEFSWESSWDHTPIIDFIDEVEAARASVNARVPLDTHGLTQRNLAYRLLGMMKSELKVESAISLCEYDSHGIAAGAVVRAAETIHRDAEPLPESAPFRAYLLELAEAERTYYGAVETAAWAADSFLRTDRGNPEPIHNALEALLAAEREMDGVERSELRAHRLSLVALRDGALHKTSDGAERAWLRVDEGAIVCVHPFGFYGSREKEVADDVKNGDRFWKFGGIVSTRKPTKTLLGNDIWDSRMSIPVEDQRSRTYGGTRVTLPDLLVTTPRSSEPIALSAEIVFSNLGNHHLILSLDVNDILPDELARLTWLFAPEYGDLVELGAGVTVAVDDPGEAAVLPVFPRIVDLAEHIITGIADALNAEHQTERPLETSSRPGMHNVIVRVIRASRVYADRWEPLEHPKEMLPLFGGQLINHPIPAGIGSIAQWASYDHVHRPRIECPTLHRDLIHIHENITLLACFGSPSFLVDCAQEALEFAFSLEGMIQAWIERLVQYFQDEIAGHLNTIDEINLTLNESGISRRERSRAERELTESVAKLEERQIELRRIRASCEVTMHFITSRAMVTSAATREMLDNFIRAAQIPQLHASYTKLASDIFSDRIEGLVAAQAREEDRRRREQTIVLIDLALTFATLVGISGLFSLAQSGLDVHRTEIVALMIGITILFSLGIGIFKVFDVGARRGRRTD